MRETQITWEDIEQSADNYTAFLREQEEALKYKEEELRRQRDEEFESVKKNQLVTVSRVLEDLKAQGVLEVVRDKWWKEGEIEPIKEWQAGSLGFLGGLKLVSKPFPQLAVHYGRNDMVTGLHVAQARTDMRIVVDFKAGMDKPCFHACCEGICIISKSTKSIKDAFSDNYPFDELVQIDDLIISDHDSCGRERYPAGIDNYQGILSLQIRDLVEYQKSRNSFPGQVRDRMAEVLDGLPEKYRDGKILPLSGILDLIHDTRGSNKLVRWLDQKFIGILVSRH